MDYNNPPALLVFIARKAMFKLDGIAQEYLKSTNKKERAKLEKKFFKVTNRINKMIKVFSPELLIPVSVKYYASLRETDGWKTEYDTYVN